jgi:uncharacterized OB-fold protein
MASTLVSRSDYTVDGKYCRRCEHYFITEGMFCERCGMRLRSPINREYMEKVRAKKS